MDVFLAQSRRPRMVACVESGDWGSPVWSADDIDKLNVHEQDSIVGVLKHILYQSAVFGKDTGHS